MKPPGSEPPLLREHRLLAGLPAALGASALVGGLVLAGGLAGAERASLGLRFQLRGPRPERAPVAIVAIDERSLSTYGQMPWSRKIFARLVDRLDGLGVSAIAFDIAFAEPGRQAPGEDAALSSALARSKRVILAAYRPLQSADDSQAALVPPIALLARKAAALGLAHFSEDPTFSVGQIEPEQHAGAALVPTLGLALARLEAERDLAKTVRVSEGEARYQGSAIHLQHLGTRPVVLDYLGPAGSIPTFSASDVLDGKVPERALAGRAVLVGATAAGMPDTGFSGPFPGPEPGVEIHATACENFLSGKELRRLPLLATAGLWLLLTAFPGALLARSDRLSPQRRVAWLLTAVMAIVAGAWQAFLAGWWLPVVAPTVLLIGCAVAGILRQESQLLRERARLLGWYATELTREAKRQREQIDGELHDEAQQLLIAMGRQIRRIRKRLDDDGLESLETLTQRVLDEILRVRKALVPKTLSRDGLRAAIAEMAHDLTDRGGPLVDVRIASWPAALDPLLESELYWLVKEALNNANKHARAQHIEITLATEGDRLALIIQDDGEGFVPGPLDVAPLTHEHTGLHRMWVRARGLGGDLEVTAAPGHGAKLTFRVPALTQTPPGTAGLSP